MPPGFELLTPVTIFRLVKGWQTDSKEVEEGCDEKLCFSEKERGKVCNDYMERS